MIRALAAILIGAVLPVGSPAPTTSPAPSASPTFKTIVTVKTTPYCTALAKHFNAAFVPMRANDRTFDVVGVQLDRMNDMFNHPDYINRFIELRTSLIRETGILQQSLRPIVQQIDRLQAAAASTKDPSKAASMKAAAAALHDAYLHQFQLATDLSGLARAMMRYDIFRGDHPLSGWTPAENQLPADEKNIKSYLEFDRQRKSITDSESKAVNIAYTIAENDCVK